MQSSLGILSYGAAALAYGAAGLMLLVTLPRSRRSSLFVAALVMTSFWAGGLALLLLTRATLPPVSLVGTDALHMLVWVAVVLSGLEPASTRRWLFGAAASAGVTVLLSGWQRFPSPSAGSTMYAALVVMALVGFLAVEQVFRNAREDQRRNLKWLCFAGGGIFAIDLFVYSQAALFGGFQPFLWEMRGFANAAVLPLVVLGVKRQAEWERELFVSRQVVFYTASLIGVGVYLFAMALAGYAIRLVGGQWAVWVELAFLAAAVVVLLAVLFSTSIRARFKVFLIKHFYRNKYDYREEWLRLTQTLSRTGDLRLVAANALEGLMRIIGGHAGELFLARDSEIYQPLASLGGGVPVQASYQPSHPLPAFLASTGWVVDSEEYEREPDLYGTAFGHPNEGLLPLRALMVPLDRQGHLQGFVVLAKPRALSSLNFEDHDILKTAGKQVAAALAQAVAQERLAETRQFEAMNQLTAFLMHDLKNIVAQQDLVVANAQRFRHRPDFIDDAISTIRSSVERMKRVLEQLASSARTQPSPGRVDVSKVIMEVRSQCADREPIPELDLNGTPAWVNMNRDHLSSVLMHLVRNAQEATGADGCIKIGMRNGSEQLEITISDTGCGMDAAFVRDRLFRAFDTTKGVGSMGIGAYQARHLVRRAGGDLEVRSERGVGTTFLLRLPSASSDAASF